MKTRCLLTIVLTVFLVLLGCSDAQTDPRTRSDSGAFLDQLARDTWTYLSSAWSTTNHLPRSWRSEKDSGGDYCNPAEIGFRMLSWIAAFEGADTMPSRL